MSSPVRHAAIYARISSDTEGLGLGVQRQINDCTAEARRRGWPLAHTYIDNDVSATRSKIRPEYSRMMRDIANGAIDGLIVWDVDRLTRTPRELEDVIDLADRHGLSLASVGGEIDLANPQGRLVARMKGSVARHETEQQSRRLKRKLQERAEAGVPHGFAAYGYRRVDGQDEIEPVQAAVIRDAAAQLLAGLSLRTVVADLNRREIPTPRGGRWSSTSLRQLLLRDRNAGLRTHLGHVIGEGKWTAIYDQTTHDRLVALLTDPTRRTSKGGARKYLLTGIARCGRDSCPGTMIVNVGRVSKGKRQPPAYVCATCTRVRRKQTSVDEVVNAVLVARLSQPDAVAALATGDPAEVEAQRMTIAGLEAKLDRAADDYAADLITSPQLTRITAALRPKIDAARAVIAARLPRAGLEELTGPEAGDRWLRAALDTRRAVIETLCTVTILPSGPGKPFDPELIQIRWRGHDGV